MIYELEYTIVDSFEYYVKLISEYSLFPYIIVASVVFAILIHINFGTGAAFYLTLVAWLLLIITTFYFRGLDMINHIDSIFSFTFYRNIFFFYWNSILGMFVIHKCLNSNQLLKATKQIILLFLILVLTNVIFSFYITGVVGNSLLMVLGNIYPMIIIGNIILVILYLYLIIYKIVSIVKNKKAGPDYRKLQRKLRR